MRYIVIISFLFFSFVGIAQPFTRKDSLMGGFPKERLCFDVKRYEIDIRVNPEKKFISGHNAIRFEVTEATKRIQLDLFANMQVDSILWQTKKLSYTREFNAVFIDFPEILPSGATELLTFYYSGHPIIARQAPWDGGFVFSKDKLNRPWIGVAVQGTGASVWYPVKDGQSDEPEQGVLLKVAVPNELINVSNGRLKGSTPLNDGYTRWDWEVLNPINTYNVTLNIGHYTRITDRLEDLDIDYYVLDYNREKAIKHFEEVKPMLTCFQSKFGPYPFKEDGYKLVETPYLGMEHQSAVAYGNNFLKGYRGMDLSGSGVGLTFDYITIHESGHEWFGNSITSRDIADMWIHEGFTQYSELVFIECQLGYLKMLKYAFGLRRNVAHDRPIIGPYGVNQEGSGDMYPKGALLLHTLRHALNNDTLWWKLIWEYCHRFKHKIIDTETVVHFFNEASGMDWTPVFNQYLRHTRLPILHVRSRGKRLEARWEADATSFAMPITLNVNGTPFQIKPQSDWTRTKVKMKKNAIVTVDHQKFFVKLNLEKNEAQ